MTYQPSEKKAVEEPCVKYARDMGIKVLKVNPLWAAGWNDRIFFIPGPIGRNGKRSKATPLIIEFKRVGGKTSPLQDKRHEELLEAGYDHHVIDSKEQGIALIRSRLEAVAIYAEGRAVDSPAPRVRAVSRPRAAKD